MQGFMVFGWMDNLGLVLVYLEVSLVMGIDSSWEYQLLNYAPASFYLWMV